MAVARPQDARGGGPKPSPLLPRCAPPDVCGDDKRRGGSRDRGESATPHVTASLLHSRERAGPGSWTRVDGSRPMAGRPPGGGMSMFHSALFATLVVVGWNVGGLEESRLPAIERALQDAGAHVAVECALSRDARLHAVHDHFRPLAAHARSPTSTAAAASSRSTTRGS